MKGEFNEIDISGEGEFGKHITLGKPVVYVEDVEKLITSFYNQLDEWIDEIEKTGIIDYKILNKYKETFR